MTRNTQHMMLFCTAVVLFVTACLHGQWNIRILNEALNDRVKTNAAMEGRVHTTLLTGGFVGYTGAEVLHTVRQMTGTGVHVELDGHEYVVDALEHRSAMIPVELDGNYRVEYNRSASGELLKLSFWKEVQRP
ncbi:hypothetical protein SAMN05720606_103100 [Paenibacillus polysaccharolyticus]|uniref:Uncharacterized protein n=1 Tax=Paenibacillus polysaccharolyticus TaxID=582692 RepID=A0A1G5E0F8_9BACL|nr:hypothetical protein [Paenibacillus polysaccharolyticus]SCY20357.1 hypothetical protein SAMN05720606_103100 [Paenibacillus polysaccharolyticus]